MFSQLISKTLKTLLFSSVAGMALPAYAAEHDGGVMEHISVLGARTLKSMVPGGATYISADDLKSFPQGDVHRILYQVPGIQIMEEDGFGLRPNIGIRGSGSERSERVNLMEDGVLIAPAPYAAPGAYYFPTVGRLQGIEVRKGSSAVKFGPRSTAGAINMLSTAIPESDQLSLMSRMGDHGVMESHLWAGGVRGSLSVLGEVFLSKADGFKTLPQGGNTGYDLQDYMAKLRWSSDQSAVYDQSFELKLAHAAQTSYETYLGLTQSDFDADPFARYAASANDRFQSRHDQITVTHHISLSPDLRITSVAYDNQFQRDWYKLDDLNLGDGRGRISPAVLFDAPENALNRDGLDVLRGLVDSGNDSLLLRHNNRAYYSRGVQSTLSWSRGAHDVQMGFRLHEDEEDRLQSRDGYRMADGAMVLTSIGAIGSQDNRVSQAKALAVFVEDTWTAGAWTFIPGVRLEDISLRRDDYAKTDPARAAGPTKSQMNKQTIITPGFGTLYDVNEDWRLIAGLYRGYAPAAPGSSAKAEKSTNAEMGLRYEKEGTQLDVVLYRNAYSNLLGTCTNGTGCANGEVGDQYNAGKVSVEGVEAAFTGMLGHSGGISFPFSLAYTYTDGTFKTSFADGFFGNVEKGDRLPYTAKHMLNLQFGLQASAWDIALRLNRQSGVKDGADGLSVPARTIMDVAFNAQLSDAVSAFITIENLNNETYVAAMRPYGMRPGKPRSINLGVRLALGGV